MHEHIQTATFHCSYVMVNIFYFSFAATVLTFVVHTRHGVGREKAQGTKAASARECINEYLMSHYRSKSLWTRSTYKEKKSQLFMANDMNEKARSKSAHVFVCVCGACSWFHNFFFSLFDSGCVVGCRFFYCGRKSKSTRSHIYILYCAIFDVKIW